MHRQNVTLCVCVCVCLCVCVCVCVCVCCAHPGNWSHPRSRRSRLHRHRSTTGGCTARWSCSWWNLSPSPPACGSASSRCGLNTKHSTTTMVLSQSRDGGGEEEGGRQLGSMGSQWCLVLLVLCVWFEARLHKTNWSPQNSMGGSGVGTHSFALFSISTIFPGNNSRIVMENKTGIHMELMSMSVCNGSSLIELKFGLGRGLSATVIFPISPLYLQRQKELTAALLIGGVGTVDDLVTPGWAGDAAPVPARWLRRAARDVSGSRISISKR